MDKQLLQDYGPLIGHPTVTDVSAILWISEQAFLKCSEYVNSVPEVYNTKEGRTLTILNNMALNASYSIRLMTSYAQLLEAFALLRMRLEQVIKCSYLIHADPQDGLVPFMQDAGRVDHSASEYIKRQDSDLYQMISFLFPGKIESARERAIENERSINPDFDPATGKIEEGWTDLNNYAMASKRDEMADTDDPISGTKLQWYYLTLYKSACKYIHSGSACLTDNFFTVNETANGPQLGPQMAYFFNNLLQVAQLDLIQCYEIVKYFDADGSKELLALNEQYKSLIPLKEILSSAFSS